MGSKDERTAGKDAPTDSPSPPKSNRKAASFRKIIQRLTLIDMAMSGIDFGSIQFHDIKRIRDAFELGTDAASFVSVEIGCVSHPLTQVIARGIDVLEAIDAVGDSRAIKSISDARCLRITLGFMLGRLKGCGFDTQHNDENSVLRIAEMRMGIRRFDNGQFNKEWN